MEIATRAPSCRTLLKEEAMENNSHHVKVICAENCGNSPKKKLLKELSVAFAKNEFDFCVDWVTDDIIWEIVGDQTIQGKSDFERALNQFKDRKVQQLSIENIITHGNTGSVNGELTLNNHQRVAFCDIYNFRGFRKDAKIKAITSYAIPLS